MEAPSRLGMNDAPSITNNWINNSNIITYIIEENKFVLNSAWNEDLPHKLIFWLKSTKFEIYPR